MISVVLWDVFGGSDGDYEMVDDRRNRWVMRQRA